MSLGLEFLLIGTKVTESYNIREVIRTWIVVPRAFWLKEGLVLAQGKFSKKGVPVIKAALMVLWHRL